MNAVLFVESFVYRQKTELFNREFETKKYKNTGKRLPS